MQSSDSILIQRIGGVFGPFWRLEPIDKIVDSKFIPIAGITFVVLLWAIVSYPFNVTIFPSPLDVVYESKRLLSNGSLFLHTGVSLFRLSVGFVIGSAIAIPIGLGMGLNSFFRRMMQPITEFFRFIPAIAMIVLALIWFGIGETSKIFLIVYNTFLTVVIGTEAGVEHVRSDRKRVVESLGGTKWDVVRFVVIPSVIPFILSGLRLGMSRAFMTIVSAEILAANTGLGYLIYSSREYCKTDTSIVGIVLLGALGLCVDRVLGKSVNRLGGAYLHRVD